MKQLVHKCSESDEIHVVFDRYDVELSLKSATRVQRQGGQDRVYFRITDSTHIGKVPMRNFCLTTKLKWNSLNTLQERLQIMQKSLESVSLQPGELLVRQHKNVAHLQNTQEEADTKILLHAVDAAALGATEINIHSSDSDVFILSLR